MKLFTVTITQTDLRDPRSPTMKKRIYYTPAKFKEAIDTYMALDANVAIFIDCKVGIKPKGEL